MTSDTAILHKSNDTQGNTGVNSEVKIGVTSSSDSGISKSVNGASVGDVGSSGSGSSSSSSSVNPHEVFAQEAMALQQELATMQKTLEDRMQRYQKLTSMTNHK